MAKRRSNMANGGNHDQERQIIEKLNSAIDTVTNSLLEKLTSVKIRVECLEQAIKDRSSQIKKGHAELVRLINNTNGETDRLHENIDAVEQAMTQPTETQAKSEEIVEGVREKLLQVATEPVDR